METTHTRSYTKNHRSPQKLLESWGIDKYERLSYASDPKKMAHSSDIFVAKQASKRTGEYTEDYLDKRADEQVGRRAGEQVDRRAGELADRRVDASAILSASIWSQSASFSSDVRLHRKSIFYVCMNFLLLSSWSATSWSSWSLWHS